MNKKAEELNLVNTHFVTPHGLDNSKHFTTAYELALLTDYALDNKKFAEIVNTKTYTITINGYSKVLNNTNELLGNLEGVNGVKTGFTNNAGRCLVTSTTRSGRQIISVVLGADTKKYRTKDSVELIEYTFNNYEWIDLRKIIDEEFNKWRNENEKNIFVEKGMKNEIKVALNELSAKIYPIKKEDIKNIKCEIETVNFIKAPVSKGQIIGSLQVNIGDKNICNLDIITDNEIEKKSVQYYFTYFICNLGKFWEDVL